MAKPFLKWAGGKTQLIKEIETVLPSQLLQSEFTYIEPFVGSGAILFWMLRTFPNIKKAVINDINKDLVNTYQVIASTPLELIEILTIFEREFYELEENEEKKKVYFYKKRALYNTRSETLSMQAALFIFLNRTCFNGLYRVNKKNLFNVPIGRYKKPRICDTSNILAVNEVLQKVEILHGDYQETLKQAEKNTLFYFDPPYKPLNNTSSFTAYAKSNFNDDEQVRLKNFCTKLDKLNYHWILSNSDVKSIDNDNDFFDDLYHDFFIKRINAKRNINSNAKKRGLLKELLITN
ncbi:MAG: DNA adenine methylase [Saprospiraceae bacterium]